jgi:C-terminal processing protease CtpA/Prc
MTRSVTVFSLAFSLLFALTVFGAEPKPEMEKKTWLGVSISDLSEKMLKNLGIEHGIAVEKVIEDSPAAAAGLEEEDILLSYNGKALHSSDELVEMVRDGKPGDKVELTYLRDGKKNSVKTELAAQSRFEFITQHQMPKIKKIMKIAEPGAWLGVVADDLNDQLREYFKVEAGKGLLIKEVMKDSPAEKGGLRAGDVILQIGDKEINSFRDLTRTVNYYDPENTVTFKVKRSGSDKKMDVTLGKKEMPTRHFFHGKHPLSWEDEKMGRMPVEMIDDVEVFIDSDANPKIQRFESEDGKMLEYKVEISEDQDNNDKESGIKKQIIRIETNGRSI